MKLLLVFVVLIVAGFWLFNRENPEKTGLFRSEEQAELSLLPNKNAAFKETQASRTVAGTYQISDGFLYLYLAANDVRRLQIQGDEFVYDPDAGMPQPTPLPAQSGDNGRLTPAERAELEAIRQRYGGGSPLSAEPTPRPKQTFRRVTPAT